MNPIIKWYKNYRKSRKEYLILQDKIRKAPLTSNGRRYDPIENDQKIKEIIQKAYKEANIELRKEYLERKHSGEVFMCCEPGQMGYCHSHWRRQKKILKEKYNIDWRTPAEMNPHIIFD